MSNNKTHSLQENYFRKIKSLLSEYEAKEKGGICFKHHRDKNPLDIIGVLDLLKYKIKKWGNTNIFTYQGRFFDDNTILVIGSNNIEEAKNIIIYVFLNEILNNREELFNKLREFSSNVNLERYLDETIFKDLVKGYPNDLNLESKLKNHLENLLKS